MRSLPMKSPFIWRQFHNESLHLEVAKTMRSLYVGGSCTMSPSNLEARGSPCNLVLCDDGHKMSSFCILAYPRVVKIKDICRHPRDDEM